MTATWSESCSRDAISCDTGLPVHIDTPKSPVSHAAQPLAELHVDRLVEPEARALRLDDRLRDVGAVAAQHHFDRIAAHQAQHEEHQDRDPEQRRDHQQQPLSDVAEHGSGPGERKRGGLAAPPRSRHRRGSLPVEPDVGQVLPDVVAGRDVPALQLLVVDDDAVPPDRRDRCTPARARASRTRAAARSASSCRARPTACRRARRACGRSAARS